MESIKTYSSHTNLNRNLSLSRANSMAVLTKLQGGSCDRVSFGNLSKVDFAYKMEELPQLAKHLNDFYESIIKDFDVKHPAKIFIGNLKGNVGLYETHTNQITLDEKFLTNPDLCKLVSKETGKCLKNPNSPILIVDSKENIQRSLDYCKKNNIALDGDIVPFTKKDRENFAKTLIYHETVHSEQFDQMRRTEGIGWEGVAKIGEKGVVSSLVNKLIFKRIAESVWKPFKDEENEFIKDSEIGKKSYRLLEEMKGYNLKSFGEDYYGNSFEREAYSRQEEFARKNNLEV